MTAFLPIIPRLERLIPRLASDHDGEVIATTKAIGRTLEAAGLDWHDLAAAVTQALPPAQKTTCLSETDSWGELANWCRFNGSGRLSLKEQKFVGDMSRKLVLGGEPSPRQADWLRSIYARLKGGDL